MKIVNGLIWRHLFAPGGSSNAWLNNVSMKNQHTKTHITIPIQFIIFTHIVNQAHTQLVQQMDKMGKPQHSETHFNRNGTANSASGTSLHAQCT